MNGSVIIVQTTVASREEADKLADALVSRRLAACVQMTAIHSTYRWAGEVQNGTEYRLDIKTAAARKADLLKGLGKLHPYEVPEVLVFATDDAGLGYAKWVEDETR